MKQQLSELLETGVYESFKPEKQVTIKELLGELGLEGKYFGILVNGRKTGEDYLLKESDEVVILPHIAGGEDMPIGHVWLPPCFFYKEKPSACPAYEYKKEKEKKKKRWRFRKKKVD